MQKHVNLVDHVKSFPTNILLQNLASIQKRTSPVKFAHLAEKSGNGSTSNLSTKARASAGPPDCRAAAAFHRGPGADDYDSGKKKSDPKSRLVCQISEIWKILNFLKIQ